MRTPAKPVIRKQLKPSKEPADLSSVRASLSTLQDQLAVQPRILPHIEGGKRPKGVKRGDRLMGRGARGVVIGIPDSQGNVKQSEVPDSVTQYQDPQTGIIPPTAADNFPVDGDFGWYRDTASTIAYMSWNNGGTLFSLSNSITTLAGSITAAQHGNFAAIAANDNLHAPATSFRPGFLTASGFILLNNATDLETPSTLAQRDSGGSIAFDTCRLATALRVGPAGSSLKVVGPRDTGWSMAGGLLQDKTLVAFTPSAVYTPADLTQIMKYVDALFGLVIGHGLAGT